LGKGEKPEPKPVRPRLLISGDATPEKLGVLLAEQGERIAIASAEGALFDHLSGLYAKNGASNLDLYLSAYDGDAASADRISRETVPLDRPHLAMTLAVQPAVIRELGKQPRLRGRGLLARFAYSFPASKIGERTYEAPPVDPVARDDWHHLILRLGRAPMPKEPEVLRFTPEAWTRLHQAMLEIERALKPGASLYGVRDWGNKLRGLLARLAGLLHVAEETAAAATPSRVSLATMERALQIGRYLTRHTRFALETEMSLEPAEQNARLLWEVIQRRGWQRVTPRVVSASVRALRKTTDAIAALEVLVQQGCLERDAAHHGQAYRVRSEAGGRPGGGDC
jgi:Protein of unknown function (DUF3987)